MPAWNYVGRVGGLAVALGVGAAAFHYSALASAETPSADTGSSSAAASATTPSTSNRRGQSGGSPRTTGDGTTGNGFGSTINRSTSKSLPPAPTADRPASAAVTLPARVAAALPTPTAEPESGSVTALKDPATELVADDNPGGLPVGSPMEWTALAYARREVTGAGASAGTLTPAVRAAAATQPMILGPSGVPIPSQNYVDTVMDFYILPHSPEGANAPQVVFTPEGLYPITGVKSLPLNTSVDQGMTILSETLGTLPGGTTTTVFGYSQSSIISSLLQAGYLPPDSPYVPPKYPLPTIPDDLQDSINFVLVANEMNPNGGFLSRFPDLNLPSLGIPFYGAVPEDAYPTVSYAREYDGFADFPRYTMNFLSVLNAGLGIVFVHTQYVPAADCTGSFCLTKEQVETAIPLPTTSPTQQYYFMPTENLPLLEPLRLIPIIGNPIADLIQPVLKVIVDLGYADPAHGFATATQPYANVLVPFGVIPDVSPLEVLEKLVAGVEQGINDFIADLGPGGSVAREISAITLPSPSFSLPSPDDVITAVQNVVLGVAERISVAAAGIYAALLPTADVINAIVTILPAYNVDLFLEGIKQMLSGDLIGGLVNAIGLPIAADVGLITTAGLIVVLAWGQAALAVLAPNANIGT
ncbi:MAG: PE-PPE domain-containing protein [Mycobacterium sp.]|nr:MAG: PE-PPE domain-containing protein [Mycobacterium sp.]